MASPCTFKKLIKKLKKYDSRFLVWENRGKGSERMISHPDINGEKQSIPVKCHGEGTELRRGVISDIIKRFDLPKGVL